MTAVADDENPEEAPEPEAAAGPAGGDLVYRHRWPTRLWHWMNALTVFVMLMSGLMIFNAHPRLYWGKYGANADARLAADRRRRRRTASSVVGRVEIDDDRRARRWTDHNGNVSTRAFPGLGDDPVRLQSRRRADAGISCSPGCSWSRACCSGC